VQVLTISAEVQSRGGSEIIGSLLPSDTRHFKVRKAVSLDPLPRSESLALLCRLAPRLKSEPPEVLYPVADQLGDLPSAIDLAGHYLKERASLLPQEYLAELGDISLLRRHEALQHWAEVSSLPQAVPLTMAFLHLWHCLDIAKPVDILAQRLFVLAGYCAPDTPIPPIVLKAAVKAPREPHHVEEHLPVPFLLGDLHGIPPSRSSTTIDHVPSSPIQRFKQRLFPARAATVEEQASRLFDGALKRLIDLGLLVGRSDAPMISLLLGNLACGLAEEPAVESLTADQPLLQLAEALAQVTYESFVSDQIQLCALRPHIEAVAPLCEVENPELSAKLWNNLGAYLLGIKEFSSAQVCLQHVLLIDERLYGSEHPKVMDDLNNLGVVLEALGDQPSAQQHYARALEISEHANGQPPAAAATTLKNLGILLRQQGDLSAAQRLFERAVQVSEQVYGPEHPMVAGSLNELGLLMQDRGDLESAQQNFMRALRIDERVYGPQHAALITALNNLAIALRDWGDLPGARQQLERALHIEEHVYGVQHPKVAARLNNLGSVLKAEGNLVGARQRYEQALRIDEQAYGPHHPKVIANHDRLGEVLIDLGDLLGAKRHLERSIEATEQIYGPEHPDVAASLNNLGIVLQLLGSLPQAKQQLERALQIGEKTYGPEHPNVVACRYHLGGVLKDLGDLRGAKEQFERGLSAAEHAYGTDHPEIAMRLNSLGCVLSDLGDYQSAKQHFERAMSICQHLPQTEEPLKRAVQINLEAVRRKT
jgi:tetratricopeptide (TPR) repeat protein